MANKKFSVFALGTPVVDYFASCNDSFIAKNKLNKNASNYISREELDSLCKNHSVKITHVLPGDNARNVCEGIARLGGNCAYAGRIGADKEGKIFSASLKKNKILSYLEKTKGYSGKALTLITPDHARTFALNLGSTEQYKKIGKKEEKILAASSFLFLTSITFLSKGPIGASSRKYVECAKKHGAKVVFSLESYPMISKNWHDIIAFLNTGAVDILLGNEQEFSALGYLHEDELKVSTKHLAPIVVYKKGRHGATIFSEESHCNIAPPHVKHVIDTTGAGDAFAAGFLHALSKGKSLEQSGSIGAALSGKIIGKFGATFD